MFGLLLAFLSFLYQLGFQKENQFVALKRAGKFLFYWYMTVGLFVTGAVGVLLLLFGPLVLLGLHLPFVGVLLGISTLGIVMLMLIPYTFEVLGAKLLYDSLTLSENNTPTWDLIKVMLGAVSLGLGLAMIHFLS